MCSVFSELAHHLAVMHAHIMHISQLTAEMAICVQSRGPTQLAPDLSDAALQVSVNAQEIDAEARRVREIAKALINPAEPPRADGVHSNREYESETYFSSSSTKRR